MTGDSNEGAMRDAIREVMAYTAERLVQKLTGALDRGLPIEDVERTLISFYGQAAEQARRGSASRSRETWWPIYGTKSTP
jgi:hypothetical protein